MRRFLLLAILALAACTEASISRIDSRTFAIESPGIPGGSEAPNRRLAERACPGGYRVMDRTVHQGTPDRARDLVYRLGFSKRRRPDEKLEVDEWWIRDLADELAVGYNRFKEWAKKGYVHSRRIGKRKHLVIWADAV